MLPARLTKSQAKLRKKALELAELARIDFWNAEEWDKAARTPLLEMAINRIVIVVVISEYTLIDDTLATILCREYFKETGKKEFIFWKKKNFRIFVQYILDEMYLLKKMEAVHAIKSLPKELREILRKLNAIRNALAHSFFPENRKEYRQTRKVLYREKDIRTPEGLALLRADTHRAFIYLAKRAYGTCYDDAGLPRFAE